MKGRIIGSLFALPFFGVGVWMLWSVGSSAYEVWEMRSWQPTPAQLTSAGYSTNSGGDSNTYEAYARATNVSRLFDEFRRRLEHLRGLR